MILYCPFPGISIDPSGLVLTILVVRVFILLLLLLLLLLFVPPVIMTSLSASPGECIIIQCKVGSSE